MTEVYVFDADGAPPEESGAALLPSWRRERLAELTAPGVRRESLAAGLLLAYAMAARGVPADEPVRLLPAGKPVFAARDDVWFSLSHSGRWAMCAMGPGPVGADVQIARPTRLSIARRFHPAERAWLEALPEGERMAGLFRLWTRKEAWVKAVSGERMLSLSEADVTHPVPGLWFRDYTLPDGSPAAVCAGEERIGPARVVEREELLTVLEREYHADQIF